MLLGRKGPRGARYASFISSGSFFMENCPNEPSAKSSQRAGPGIQAASPQPMAAEREQGSSGPRGGGQYVLGPAPDWHTLRGTSPFQANAIGRGAKSVREFLEKNYTDEAIETDGLTIKLVIKALLEVSARLGSGQDGEDARALAVELGLGGGTAWTGQLGWTWGCWRVKAKQHRGCAWEARLGPGCRVRRIPAVQDGPSSAENLANGRAAGTQAVGGVGAGLPTAFQGRLSPLGLERILTPFTPVPGGAVRRQKH